MLPLFARRVVISAHRSTATYARISPSFVSAFHSGRLLDSGLRTGTAHLLANPRRNASVKATAATNETKSSTQSKTTEGKKPREKLTPEKKAAQKGLRLAKKSGKEGEAKKPKIIKPPPRSINGFALFVHDSKKVVPECLDAWKGFSEEKKQEYHARAKEVSEKRKEEHDAFVKTVSRLDIQRYNKDQRAKGRRRVIRVKSTRPLTSFFRYLVEFRALPDQVGKPAREVSSACGAAWRSLTLEEKEKYKSVP